MDKFMDNPWFIRIIAMLLALLLYASAYIETKDENKDTGQKNNSDTIENVPVALYYDQENLVVSGAPETVNVIIDGPKNIVEAAKIKRDFTVYIDLSDAKIGKQRVKIKSKDLSDKLDAEIDPGYAEISVQEKVTKDFKVEAEFNSSMVAEGFEAGSPEVNPKSVKVTGAKDDIAKISYVKATIDTNKEIDSTVSREAKVLVLDKYLNKLDVVVDPETVEVTIPVINPSKTVPVSVNPLGKEKDGITIKSITTEPKNVTIYGNTNTLATIDDMSVSVDISKYDKNTEIEVPIKHPDGINKIEPEKVLVKINVEEIVEEKTISNIKVSDKGLNDDYNMEWLSPESGVVDLLVNGTSSQLKNVDASNFDVFMDLAGLAPGDHEVNLEVEGPKDVTWELNAKKVKIRLTEKESGNI